MGSEGRMGEPLRRHRPAQITDQAVKSPFIRMGKVAKVFKKKKRRGRKLF